MYRQILITESNRDYQQILWRSWPSDSICEFQLNTITYGLTSAPFLAIRTLRQLAEDERVNYPCGAEILEKETYMDDILTGADTLSDAKEKLYQLIKICSAGGFVLKKWAASLSELLKTIPSVQGQGEPLEWHPAEGYSILGLHWHPVTDSFTFKVNPTADLIPTKRQVLSETARLFDLLGWLGPVIVRAKILLQSFWLQKIDWDQPLSIKDQETWKIFRKELRKIEEISLPRWIYTFSTDCTIELHGFSDASEKAYVAVVYIRVTTVENNDFKSRIALLQAKKKVAPLKTISLPRLELNAAALLVKLINNIKHGAKFQIANIHLWTDLIIALAWIQGHPSRWTTFVANRVTEIQETLPEALWHHVPGEENPADCASRGLSAVAFKNHPLWWQGPTWLQHTDHLLLRLVGNPSFQTKEETRPAKAHLGTQTPEENPILLRFSNLQRFLRVCALCRRWLLKNFGKRNEPILPNEIEEIQNYWITNIQATWFPEEINNLIKNKPLFRQNPLIKFTLVLDDKKLLRVGGRLQHAAISFDSRNPILLPRNFHFTKLIVDTCHRRTLHGGVQLTLAVIRQQYWIIGAQTLVKNHIHKCVVCTRWRGQSPHPLMSPLPNARVLPSRPFQNTGVDYAGPILMRTSKGRGQKSHKGFIAIFVCFATRAIHLEAVSDYTTEAFLAAFRRFTSRRGLCSDLYSDRGTNFVGADAQLRGFIRDLTRNRQFLNNLANDGIRWHFNPLSAPHFGGIWEAAVKSTKHHIHRVIGNAKLTFEELITFLSQVEACLNSRPLAALTNNPQDLEALSPDAICRNPNFERPQRSEFQRHMRDALKTSKERHRHRQRNQHRPAIGPVIQRNLWNDDDNDANTEEEFREHESDN
ncbi:uncharacterized protein [Cardiocondyla obscurior]|uniref:uncharacterized protein n=1 Tax=Cardiocondyla obscurior TaxID=286306 RepID=UPI00396575F2